jgi:hypothetical protein
MKHYLYGDAVINLYSQVRAVDDLLGILDEHGNQVVVDEAAVAAEIQRLQPIKKAEQASRNRQQAYIAEADPLFFKAQRSEATVEEWQAKVAEIKARFPKE